MSPVKNTFSDKSHPLVYHLEEFRTRILISLGWFLALSLGAYFFVDPVLNWLAKPVGGFVYMAPTDALFIRIKITFGMGAVAAFPIFIFELWKFVHVGLLPKERSLFLMVVPVSIGLFAFGVFLVLFGVAPLAVKFLLSFSSENLRPFISVQAYLSFLLGMILGFGILFQMPLVLVILTRAGILKVKTLKAYRKHVIVGVLVASAFLTPGQDVVSQLILTLPSYLLFEVSLFISSRFE